MSTSIKKCSLKCSPRWSPSIGKHWETSCFNGSMSDHGDVVIANMVRWSWATWTDKRDLYILWVPVTTSPLRCASLRGRARAFNGQCKDCQSRQNVFRRVLVHDVAVCVSSCSQNKSEKCDFHTEGHPAHFRKRQKVKKVGEMVPLRHKGHFDKSPMSLIHFVERNKIIDSAVSKVTLTRKMFKCCFYSLSSHSTALTLWSTS